MSIGEQLEQIDRQRTRAADAKELIHYFADFNRGDTESLDQVKNSGKDGERKVMEHCKHDNSEKLTYLNPF